MAWRPAYSLETLKSQLDAAYPGWTFLGFLGDQAHAAVASDHNPNAAGVVCALDIGPGGGLDIFALADSIAANPHPDLKYIISNRRIANWQTGFKWEAYNGSDPHDTHIHVSVGRGSDGQSVQPYDDRVQWNIEGDDMTLKDDDVAELFRLWAGREPTEEERKGLVGKYLTDATKYLRQSGGGQQIAAERLVGDRAIREKWLQNIQDLNADIQKLKAGGQISQDTIDNLSKQAQSLADNIKKVKGQP